MIAHDFGSTRDGRQAVQRPREVDAIAEKIGPRILFVISHSAHRIADVEFVVPQATRQFFPAQRHRHAGARFARAR